MQARPVMSSFDPSGQVQRKLPNVFKQLPFLHGVILHSSTSILTEKTKLSTQLHLCCDKVDHFYKVKTTLKIEAKFKIVVYKNTLKRQYNTKRNKPKRNKVVYDRA